MTVVGRSYSISSEIGQQGKQGLTHFTILPGQRISFRHRLVLIRVSLIGILANPAVPPAHAPILPTVTQIVTTKPKKNQCQNPAYKFLNSRLEEYHQAQATTTKPKALAATPLALQSTVPTRSKAPHAYSATYHPLLCRA